MLRNIKDTPKATRAGLPLEARRSTLRSWRLSDPMVQLSGE
jgi:hypothetical protein